MGAGWGCGSHTGADGCKVGSSEWLPHPVHTSDPCAFAPCVTPHIEHSRRCHLVHSASWAAAPFWRNFMVSASGVLRPPVVSQGAGRANSHAGQCACAACSSTSWGATSSMRCRQRMQSASRRCCSSGWVALPWASPSLCTETTCRHAASSSWSASRIPHRTHGVQLMLGKQGHHRRPGRDHLHENTRNAVADCTSGQADACATCAAVHRPDCRRALCSRGCPWSGGTT